MKQSDKKISVAVIREELLAGHVNVPWHTKSVNPLLSDLDGVLTFGDQHSKASIVIDFPREPQHEDSADFLIILGKPRGSAELCPDNSHCKVSIAFDIKFHIIGFQRKIRQKAKQSDKTISIPVQRKGSTDGEILVSWKVDAQEDSPYCDVFGDVMFDHGDS